MTNTKFCKDCRWIKLYEIPERLDLSSCAHPKAALIESGDFLVTGKTRQGFATNERMHGSCGLSGTNWESTSPVPAPAEIKCKSSPHWFAMLAVGVIVGVLIALLVVARAVTP